MRNNDKICKPNLYIVKSNIELIFHVIAFDFLKYNNCVETDTIK